MKLNPPKGMRDILVNESALRSAVLDKIISSYTNAGFFQISTPAIEDKENISKSDGGDNLNLVFEIMKRGQSLEDAIENKSELSDMALRYDLTLPLSRCYSANKDSLPNPFKVIQTGLVYRAERPQKGRLREFRQCDIDIIGDESIDAELELFSTSLAILKSLGFDNITLRVNDRRVLYVLLESFGFDKSSIPSVCITFDKMDKVGRDGLEKELSEKGFGKKPISSLLDFIDFINTQSDSDKVLDYTSSLLKDKSALNDVKSLIASLAQLVDSAYKIQFSPSLIRGQGYYTGIVAEAYSPEFSSAVAAGGRYDGMIAKFTGRSTPAVGFSIGFERIMSIIIEKGIKLKSNDKIALVYDTKDNFVDVMKKKSELMKKSDVSVFKAPKNKKKFYSDLQSLGFSELVDFSTGAIKPIGGAP